MFSERVHPAPGRSSSITCCAASRSVGSLRARAPLLMAIDKLLCEKEKNETHAVETHTTACTTSVMTALVGISSLSTPGNPSARVGPTLRCKTGLRNSSACFSRLYYNIKINNADNIETKHTERRNMLRVWCQRRRVGQRLRRYDNFACKCQMSN